MQRTSWIWLSLFVMAVRVGPVASQALTPDINVDTWAGVVALFGTLPSQEAKAVAEADAHKVTGIKRIENELEGVAGFKQAAGQMRDEELKRDVQKVLDAPAFKDITVDVKNGVVRLMGTVPSWAWRLEAVAAARVIPGVYTVEDDLRLMLGV